MSCRFLCDLRFEILSECLPRRFTFLFACFYLSRLAFLASSRLGWMAEMTTASPLRAKSSVSENRAKALPLPFHSFGEVRRSNHRGDDPRDGLESRGKKNELHCERISCPHHNKSMYIGLCSDRAGRPDFVLADLQLCANAAKVPPAIRPYQGRCPRDRRAVLFLLVGKTESGRPVWGVAGRAWLAEPACRFRSFRPIAIARRAGSPGSPADVTRWPRSLGWRLAAFRGGHRPQKKKLQNTKFA